MRTIVVVIAAAVAATSPVPVLAGPSGYVCKVESELHLGDDGKLGAYPRPLEQGKVFAVARSNGQLVESTPSFWSPNDAETTVLARGNRENSFVVTYIAPSAGGGVHVSVLQVQEFVAAEAKPFLLISGSSAYSGTCR